MTHKTCPVQMLQELHEAATAGLEAAGNDEGNILVSRLGAVQDVMLQYEAHSPEGLRLQAEIIREEASGTDHGEHVNGILRLAAAYADRLADVPPPARAPRKTVSVLDLDEVVNPLQDAVSALVIAARGLREAEERQGISAIADMLAEKAAAVFLLANPEGEDASC